MEADSKTSEKQFVLLKSQDGSLSGIRVEDADLKSFIMELEKLPSEKKQDVLMTCRAALSMADIKLDVSGHASEVKDVASTLLRQAKQHQNDAEAAQRETNDKSRSLWVGGSFFIMMFLIVSTTLLVIIKLVSPIYLPIFIVGGVLMFSIMSAFVLRQQDTLSEKPFLDLMKLSFKYLPFLRSRK